MSSQTYFSRRKTLASFSIEDLELEIAKTQKQLEQEIEKEANIPYFSNRKTTKKIFRASRITAYRLNVLRNKLEQKKNLQARLSKTKINIAYAKLETELESLDTLLLLRKNLVTNITEKVISSKVDEANELLKQKRILDRRIERMKKEL